MVPFASAPANVGTSEHRSVAAVVPAAGRSSRFGGMKLLADVGGEPLVNRTLGSLLETGRVVVPVFKSRRGHPIGIPGGLRDGLLMMPPDRSLKDALAALGEELLLVDVDDEGVVRDVDVKSDLY